MKNTKRQDVKQANKNINDSYAHKTSKKKKITCLTFYAFYSFHAFYFFCAFYSFYVFYSFCAFYSFYSFYSFYACEIVLITSFTILLTSESKFFEAISKVPSPSDEKEE